MEVRNLIPTEPTERRKLFVAVGVIAICAAWLLYFAATHVSRSTTGKPPSTPGWTAASEINKKLLADHALMDVGVAVVSEKPLKFKVNGGVYAQTDLDRLPGLLKEINPDAEYELNVSVLKR